MNQKEAAAFLGISERMLRTYTAQGRIGAEREIVRGRRTLVYDPAALEALREERAGERRWRTPPPENPSTGLVSFRLDAYYLERLTGDAAARGMSRGEYARFLLLQALEGRAGVEALRADLANAVYALLVAAGDQEPAKAQEWVRKNLLKK